MNCPKPGDWILLNNWIYFYPNRIKQHSLCLGRVRSDMAVQLEYPLPDGDPEDFITAKITDWSWENDWSAAGDEIIKPEDVETWKQAIRLEENIK